MLLNSYEGFDYMDYSRYSMSTKDWGIVFIKSMAATVIIAYLFYDSPIVVIAFPAVFAYCAKPDRGNLYEYLSFSLCRGN